jgi:hypothetical protein
MTGGYSTVPDDLYRTANKIGDAVGAAAGLSFVGPSGDYGHAGVQSGWAQFMSDLGVRVKMLREKADGHGESLKTAAGSYAEIETQGGEVLGKLGGLFDGSSGLTGVSGGGFTGGIADVLGGALGEPEERPYERTIGSQLDGVPGGGYTGGLTPSQLDERLREEPVDGGPTGIMSPERSKELFPDASGGHETPTPEEDGRVY